MDTDQFNGDEAALYAKYKPEPTTTMTTTTTLPDTTTTTTLPDCCEEVLERMDKIIELLEEM